MQFAGVLPEDAPDPQVEVAARLQAVPFAVFGLRRQSALEDYGEVGFADSHDSSGPSQLSVSIGYTLWRNPDDRDDPGNLAELDERTRASIEQVPPWPRPAWLIERVQRMRYPHLWEAVHTTWSRDPSEYTTLSWQLADHVNYILMNQFRGQLGLPSGPTSDTTWRVTESAVNPAVTVRVNDVDTPAAEIDTDPFVYAIGVSIAPDIVATAVIPREHLGYVDVAFETRK